MSGGRCWAANCFNTNKYKIEVPDMDDELERIEAALTMLCEIECLAGLLRSLMSYPSAGEIQAVEEIVQRCHNLLQCLQDK